MKRHTTRAEDASYLKKRFEQMNISWKVGDACLPYRGRADEVEPTTIVKIEGDIIHLANGDSMHRSHMRSPLPVRAWGEGE